MKSQKLGVIQAVIAFTLWGLAPIYWQYFNPIGALELLRWRVVITFFTALFALPFIYGELKQSSFKFWLKIFCSTALIGINWFIFIYAIALDQVYQTSLGYFLSPIFALLFSFLIFKEKFPLKMRIAIALGLLASGLQWMAHSQVSWVAICLGISFALYGVVRKTIKLSSLTGVFLESLLLLPLFWLVPAKFHTLSEIAQVTNWPLVLMMGIVTLVPLLLYKSSVSRISLAQVAIFQYLAPSISLCLAIFYFHESIPPLSKTAAGIAILGCLITVIPKKSKVKSRY